MILRNLATQLFEHGRITTTETKARRLQPLAEKLITKAKRGDLASRRLVLQSVTSQEVVHQLFAEIAPSLQDREGGYTRITKIGPRKGDNAPMAVIEIVTETLEESRSSRSKAPRAAANKAAVAEKPAAKQATSEDKAEEKAAAEESAVEPQVEDKAQEAAAQEATQAADEAAATEPAAAEEASDGQTK